MLSKCNESIKIGDMVLIMKSTYSDFKNDDNDNNDKSAESSNRTHDVHVNDCEVYKINLIRKLCTYQDKFQLKFQDKGILDMYEDEYNKMSMLRKSKYIFRRIKDVEYYVSVIKSWCPSGNAKANFRVYPEEFLNLTFLNSVDLTEILDFYSEATIQLGESTLEFSKAKKYLHAAISFLEEREAEVSEWISEINLKVLEDSRWPCELSKWMVRTGVHKLSPFRIKQFIKSLKL